MIKLRPTWVELSINVNQCFKITCSIFMFIRDLNGMCYVAIKSTNYYSRVIRLIECTIF